jgi:hypothetical protein
LKERKKKRKGIKKRGKWDEKTIHTETRKGAMRKKKVAMKGK